MDIQKLSLEGLAALAKSLPSRMKTAAAAVRLGVKKRTLEQWRHDRYGPPFIKIGKKIVLYEVAELDKFVAAGKRRSTSDNAPD